MQAYLIVGIAGRMLAKSAKRGGYKANVIDLFADRDTRDYAVQAVAVPGRAGTLTGLDAAATVAAADVLAPPDACAGLVTASGFEDDLDTLAKLMATRKACCNAPATIKTVKDPRTFFALLDELAIPYPQTQFDRPVDTAGWLAKRIGASGGSHVRGAEHASAADHYFQRRVDGASRSACFLANGERAVLVGFSEPWTTRLGDWPYVYAGAIGRADVPQAVADDLLPKLDQLVRRTGLVGLNGIDFLLTDDGGYSVIEVNPRPPGTMDLYDDDWPRGLFDAHVHACDGELPERAVGGIVMRAHAVVYSPRATQYPDSADYHDWMSDLPEPGQRFEPRMPVCLVHAAGVDPIYTLRQLAERKSSVLGMLV